ncbi:MAG: hypothetical protein WBV23_08035 [Desulfobaccales bacterium]
MDYAKYLQGGSRINIERLAIWVALIVIAVIAGIAILGTSMS